MWQCIDTTTNAWREGTSSTRCRVAAAASCARRRARSSSTCGRRCAARRPRRCTSSRSGTATRPTRTAASSTTTRRCRRSQRCFRSFHSARFYSFCFIVRVDEDLVAPLIRLFLVDCRNSQYEATHEHRVRVSAGHQSAASPEPLDEQRGGAQVLEARAVARLQPQEDSAQLEARARPAHAHPNRAPLAPLVRFAVPYFDQAAFLSHLYVWDQNSHTYLFVHRMTDMF